MPQRFLRPGIRTSERWNSISRNAQALYVAILTLVDDHGRYDGRPSMLCADAFAIWNDQNPADCINPQETAALCGQLSDRNLVEFYELDGKKFLQVTQWKERARGPSKYPEPSAGIRCAFQPNAAKSCLLSLSLSHSPSHESSPSPLAETVVKKTTTKKPPELSDEDWIKSLEESPAYSGINVREQHAKMIHWCDLKKKQPSRARFLNWLNRCERPLAGIKPPEGGKF